MALYVGALSVRARLAEADCEVPGASASNRASTAAVANADRARHRVRDLHLHARHATAGLADPEW